MKSVMEDDDAGTASLRSEHPVACIQTDMDGWLNQRLSAPLQPTAASFRDGAAADDDDNAHAAVLSVRNTAGRLFEEPETVHVRCMQARVWWSEGGGDGRSRRGARSCLTP